MIPCLLVDDGSLVKSVNFDHLDYIGDPLNAVRIFNDLEVDELILLEISSSGAGREPPFELLSDIAQECFMPLSYGGGISNIDQVRRLFALGVEKISLNTAALESETLIEQAASEFGSQSLIVSLDARRLQGGGYSVFKDRGLHDTGITPEAHAARVIELGAGELLVTSIDNDGAWSGYDLQLIRSVADRVNVPVVASGGAGSPAHLAEAVRFGGASAVALGSMVVYQKQGLGVLINFPARSELSDLFEREA